MIKVRNQTAPKSLALAITLVEQIGAGKPPVTHTGIATFKILPVSDWQTLVKGNSDQNVLRETLLNVDNLKDESGADIEFNDDVKEALLQEGWLVNQLVQYNLAAQSGIASDVVKARILGN